MPGVAELERLASPGELAQKAFLVVPDAICVLRLADSEILEANTGSERLTGYARDELLGRRAVDLLWACPDERDQMIREARETGRVSARRWHLRHKTGKLLRVETYTESLDIGGEQCLLVATKDVSELERAEKEASEHAERIKLLYEAAFEGITVIEDGIMIDVNERLTEILGYERSDLIGMRASDTVAPESRANVAERMRTDFDQPYEAYAMRKDGTRVPMEVHGKTLEHDGRRLGGRRLGVCLRVAAVLYRHCCCRIGVQRAGVGRRLRRV